MRNDIQVKSLLGCDHVDIDAQNFDGRTALSYAIGPLNFPRSTKSSISVSGPPWNFQGGDIVKILLHLHLLSPRLNPLPQESEWVHDGPTSQNLAF